MILFPEPDRPITAIIRPYLSFLNLYRLANVLWFLLLYTFLIIF